MFPSFQAFRLAACCLARAGERTQRPTADMLVGIHLVARVDLGSWLSFAFLVEIGLSQTEEDPRTTMTIWVPCVTGQRSFLYLR